MKELAFEHFSSTVFTFAVYVMSFISYSKKLLSIFMGLTFEDRLDVIGIEMRVLKRTTGNVT